MLFAQKIKRRIGWKMNGMKLKGNELENEMLNGTISVDALEGSYGMDFIRTFGFHEDIQLVILIDSGSTTSFIDKK